MQKKVDGVRGVFVTSQFTGRSLKPFKNKALTQYYSAPQFAWLDGELVMRGGWTQPRLCSLTTGLVNTVKTTEVPDLIAFDHLHPDAVKLPYRERYALLKTRVEALKSTSLGTVHLMPYEEVRSFERVLELDAQWLDEGLEGSIIRNPDLPYKEGRSSPLMELWRIKRFIDCEARCTGLYEALENLNEAKINELGRTERSAHRENKVGKAMVGGLYAELEADVMYNGAVLFEKGQKIKIGPGQMDHVEREHYWTNQHLIVGEMVKFKTFPQGVLTKPRMPIFLSLRSAEDMS